MLVSSTSMKAAIATTTAISQGLKAGFQTAGSTAADRAPGRGAAAAALELEAMKSR